LKQGESIYKILIVEDDRIIADNVCEQLLKWGYDVKIADDNMLTVNVTRLRKKLEQAGLIDYIKTKKVPEYRQI
jgi:DNA-binding response OmpR family regulator